MAVTVDTDSYGDEAGLEAYALARGVTISGDTTILLIKAMDYLETQCYISYKYLETQNLQFPRRHTLYGDTIGETPARIIAAQYVAALLLDSGKVLNPTISRSVKREKVDIVEVEYMDNANDQEIFQGLDSLLQPYLMSSSFQTLRV